VKCPKCNHTQASATECRKCGVIFAKYAAYERRKKALETEKAQKASSHRGIFALVLFVVLITAATTYYFVAPRNQKNSGYSAQTAQAEAKIQAQKAVSEEKLSIKENDIPSAEQTITEELSEQGSPVERAKNATVSIETTWGTGSGFFITKNYIVTNKHVVEYNPEDLREIQEKVATRRQLIDLEKEKLANLRNQIRRMAEGPSKSQLKILIREREKSLARYIEQQEEGEERLAQLEKALQTPEIKVVLADGQEHYAGYVVTSPHYDLALLALFSHDGTFLRSAPQGGRSMQQGDKVFTVGSPVGLRNTVTSGVFSGFRQRGDGGQVYLQTDAAINPGNSGGPLIDENGFVHGVNTMIIKDTEGIGFAIPIEKVYEEFSSTLR
jgi:serine protease Do